MSYSIFATKRTVHNKGESIIGCLTNSFSFKVEMLLFVPPGKLQ